MTVCWSERATCGGCVFHHNALNQLLSTHNGAALSGVGFYTYEIELVA